MTTSLDALSIVPALYRTALHTARTLWPATLALFLVFVACELLDIAKTGPGDVTAMPPPALLAAIGLALLTVPYRVAFYDIALNRVAWPRVAWPRVAWPRVAWPRVAWPAHETGLRRRAWPSRVLALAGWTLLGVLVEWLRARSQAGWAASPSFLLVRMGIAALSIWVEVRLCLVGPALALNGMPIDLRAVVSATRGQVWEILLAGLLAMLPALPVALFGLVAGWGLGSALGQLPSGVVALAVGLSSVAVMAVFDALEIEIYRRLDPFSSPAPGAESRHPRP